MLTNKKNFLRLPRTKRGSVYFLVLFVLLFLSVSIPQKASAEQNYCKCLTNSFLFKRPVGQTIASNSDEDCQSYCKSLGTTRYLYGDAEWVEDGWWARTTDGDITESVETMESGLGNIVIEAIIWLLTKLLEFCGFLLSLSATVLSWMVDAEGTRQVLSSPTIYEVWKDIRDLINMAFILVLLFSAFATIFQISKYNYKKILLTLVIMALLVNFSYPITLLIVDASNVAMYSIMKSLFGSSGDGNVAVEISNVAGLEKILSPNNPSITSLLASIVFVFILALTLLAIGILLMIRVVALAIMLIFSPLGFVGQIVPGLSGKASEWWKNLFEYAFFGPMIAMFLYISVRLMESFGNSGFANSYLVDVAGQNSDIEPGLLTSATFFAVPIVVLWMGIIISQKSSVAGSNAVMGKATGYMKKAGRWAGSGFGLPRAFGVPGGVKKAKDEFKKTGTIFGKKVPLYGGSDQRERNEALVGGYLSGGKKGWIDAKQNVQNKAIAKAVDENKKDNKSRAQLEADLSSTDNVTKMAAALTLAEKGLLDDINTLEKALNAIGTQGPNNLRADEIKNQIISKIPKEQLGNIFKTGSDFQKAVSKLNSSGSKKEINNLIGMLKKENKVKALIEHDYTYGGKTKQEAFENYLGKMNGEKLAQQDIHVKIDSRSPDFDADFKNYMVNVYTDPNNVDYYKEFFIKSSREQRDNYVREGMPA